MNNITKLTCYDTGMLMFMMITALWSPSWLWLQPLVKIYPHSTTKHGLTFAMRTLLCDLRMLRFVMILITASVQLRVESRIVVYDDPSSVVIGLVMSVCSGSWLRSRRRLRGRAALPAYSQLVTWDRVLFPQDVGGAHEAYATGWPADGFMCARGASTRRTGAGTYVRSSHSARLLPLSVFLVVTRFHAPSPRACFRCAFFFTVHSVVRLWYKLLICISFNPYAFLPKLLSPVIVFGFLPSKTTFVVSFLKRILVFFDSLSLSLSLSLSIYIYIYIYTCLFGWSKLKQWTSRP
jgi:hypothetical protein